MGIDRVSIAHHTYFVDITGETSEGAEGVDDFICLILERERRVLVEVRDRKDR